MGQGMFDGMATALLTLAIIIGLVCFGIGFGLSHFWPHAHPSGIVLIQQDPEKCQGPEYFCVDGRQVHMRNGSPVGPAACYTIAHGKETTFNCPPGNYVD
jgi:hypothetical protein